MLLVVLASLPWLGSAVLAMRPSYVAKLRQETIDMFYHGYDNYMRIAFPEDEVGRKRRRRRLGSVARGDGTSGDAPLTFARSFSYDRCPAFPSRGTVPIQATSP